MSTETIECRMCNTQVLKRFINTHLDREHSRCDLCNRRHRNPTKHQSFITECRICGAVTCDITEHRHVHSAAQQSVTFAPAIRSSPPSDPEQDTYRPIRKSPEKSFITMKCAIHQNGIISRDIIRACDGCRIFVK